MNTRADTNEAEWRFVVRATETDRDALLAEAQRQDRSLNWLIVRAIREYVERQTARKTR
jgi:predicted HicB family RNase H-like nuclease